MNSTTAAKIFGFRREVKRRLGLLYAALLAANVALALWAFIAFHTVPALLATALLAYLLGLRHAVDPDHIAAIDNVTRKLMQEGQMPITVGFWFALGHSSMIIFASVAIAFTAAGIESRFAAFHDTASLVSTGISAGFLFFIAILNLSILRDLWRQLPWLRRRAVPEAAAGSFDFVNSGGLLTRIFGRLFKTVSRSWHMLPVGFLFALGFDTASEIALFGLSASEAVRNMALSNLLIFPLLFTIGMTLVDTTDGVLMLGAYHWAAVDARRKLLYNLTITSISVAVALIIGAIEVLGLVGEKLHFEGMVWTWVAAINDHFDVLGFVIIAILMAAWAAFALMHRFLFQNAAPALQPAVGGAAAANGERAEGQ